MNIYHTVRFCFRMRFILVFLIFPGTAPAEQYDWEEFTGNRGGAGFKEGTGQGARLNSPYGIARDGGGNFYVADEENHVIRKITSAGVVTTFAGSPGLSGSGDGTGSAARFNSPRGIAADAAGTVYVSDTANYTIRRITPAGVVTTIAGSPGVNGSANGTGSAASFSGVWSITLDPSGNLYAADYYSHTIRKITPAGVVTRPAGSPYQNAFTDGTGSAARFTYPAGVVSDAAGNIYITAGNLRKMTPAGVVTTVAGAPSFVGFQDGTGTNARFNDPAGMAMESSGNVLVADNNSIRRVTSAGVVTTVAGNGFAGSTDGTGSAARFNGPTGLALDASGTLFIADFNNNAIRRMTTGRAVSTFAGGPLVTGSANGTGANASFNYPMGIASDAAGFLYVADYQNSTVRKITPAGQVTTLAGAAGTSGTTDATGAAARFKQPQMLAVDSRGNVFVADRINHSIRKITPAGVVTTFAGVSGQSGPDDGTGNLARFNMPDGIAVGPDDTIYVSEAPQHRIRRITPAAVVTTLAGSAGTAGNTDGTGAAARFNNPRGLSVDRQGNIFVADNYNHIIRKITPAGAVTTIAGLGSNQGSADGQGSAARFRFPLSVAVDATGLIFVTDHGNHTIRQITPSGMVTTIGGQAGVPMIGEGRGTEARYSAPSGITIGPGGVLFVTDSGNNRIIRGTPVPPAAHPAAVDTVEDIPKSITLTGEDIDGEPLSFSIVSPPQHGTLAGTLPVITYTPSLNYNGPDSFTFKVNDGTLDSVPAIVSISIAPVNDPPLATPQSVTSVEDTPAAITLAGTDVDGDPLTFTIVNPPAHGSFTGTAPNLTYTPAADYNGQDSFTFKASDGALDSAPVMVSISIAAVNDAPVFAGPLPDIDAGPAAPDARYDLLALLRDPDEGDNHTWRIADVSNPAIFSSLSVTGGQLAVSYAPYVSGTSMVTVEVTDAAGEMARMMILVSLPVLPAPEVVVSDALKLNRQTGLWEHRITLKNTAQRAIGGLEVTVSGLPVDACLYNASDCLGPNPVAGYYQPMASGESVTMVLEYYSPSRSQLHPVITTATALPRNPPPGAPGGLAVDRVLPLPGPALLIEFTALPGHLYLVQYSADGTTWADSPARIRAAGNRVQWIDRGLPRTASPPPADGRRFYRVREVMETP